MARAGTTSEDEGADEAGITSRETCWLVRALEIVWLHRKGVLASVRGGTSRGPLRRPARPSRSRASKHASRSAPHVPPRTSSAATTTLMRPSDQPPSEGRHLAAPRGGARRDVLGVPAPRADATPSSRARQPRPPVSLRDDARHAWGRDRHVPPPHPPREIPADGKQPYVPTRVPFERPSRVPPFQPPASSRSLTFAILLHPAQRPSRVALPPRPSPRASSPPLVVRARIFDFRRRSVRLPR